MVAEMPDRPQRGSRGIMSDKHIAFAAAAILILGLIPTIVIYKIVFRPISVHVKDVRALSALFLENAGVHNHSNFSPPSNGELTDKQVQQFVTIHNHILSQLGVEYARVCGKSAVFYKEYTSDAVSSIGGMYACLDSLAPMLMRVKAIQIEALNQQELSLGEYRWVRERIYQALGEQGARFYIEDLFSTESPFAKAAVIKESKKAAEMVPLANVALVRVYQESLAERQLFVQMGF